MTDLEMTRLCAEAMGWHPHAISDKCYHNESEHRSMLTSDYDPLHDDAQVMALVKKMKVSIYAPYKEEEWECGVEEENMTLHGSLNNDLNRAIVECVAKMQQAKNAPPA